MYQTLQIHLKVTLYRYRYCSLMKILVDCMHLIQRDIKCSYFLNAFKVCLHIRDILKNFNPATMVELLWRLCIKYFTVIHV